MKTTSLYKRGFDALGLSASSLCIVHCFGIAVLGFLLPAAGLSFLASAGVHTALALVVIAAGLFAFVPGYCVHRSWLVLLFGIAGVGTIVLTRSLPGGRFDESMETALTLCGGGILIFAHLGNRALCLECHRRRK